MSSSVARRTGFALVFTGLFVGALAACSSEAASEFKQDSSQNFGNVDGGGSFSTGTSSSSGDPALQACATSSSAAQQLPVYLVVMFDKSGSMDEDSKWTSCVQGFKGFFAAPDSSGVSASLSFFPTSSSSCGTTQYATPVVAMKTLPDATTFAAKLDATTPDGSTPTLPALTGATQYAQTIASKLTDGGKVAVVLVTDGEPDGCSSSVTNVAALAATNASTIPTYVVGVGSSLTNLNTIAQAGGTKQAIIVNTSNPSQTQSDFAKALQDIRGSISCDLKLPAAPTGQTFDPASVNVVHTKSDGTTETIKYSQNCDGGSGWHYDNAASPGRILVCDGSCSGVRATGGKVDLLLGCATQGDPVK